MLLHMSYNTDEGLGTAYGQKMLRRFWLAKEHVERMRAFGKHQLFTMTQCPGEWSIGGRPPNQQVRAPWDCISRSIAP